MSRSTLFSFGVVVFALTCSSVFAEPAALPKPGPVAPPAREQLEGAIVRGVDFLLQTQKEDGSWGSPRRTKGLNIYAPVPGAHHAFMTAVSSLAVSALIESKDDRPRVGEAIAAGRAYLLRELPKVRRATPSAIYNVWAHGYGLEALARLYKRNQGDSAMQEKIAEVIESQIDLLGRYESVDGGWWYYDFSHRTKKPSSPSCSFTTGTILIALHDVKAIGFDPPTPLVDRAVDSVQRQRLPDGSYLYGEYLKYRPRRGINRPGGSLGRSQVCNAALRMWDDQAITDEVIKTWLDRLFARNEWLGMGRKRPVPHESWLQVAGYFYYYGHYYAASCIELLPASERAFYQAHLAQTLLPLQEKDGSWWDFPFYDYHQQYGTAMAVISLARCRPAE